MMVGKELAISLWTEHIEVFESFDLVCQNGHSLEDETKSNALFNAIVSLKYLAPYLDNRVLQDALSYLQGSEYYSDCNLLESKNR